jgi:hypothetical protein
VKLLDREVRRQSSNVVLGIRTGVFLVTEIWIGSGFYVILDSTQCWNSRQYFANVIPCCIGVRKACRLVDLGYLL